MRDAERLEQLREDAGRKEKAAQDRESDRNRQAGQVQKYGGKASQAAHRAGTGRDKLAQALRDAADAARCAPRHQTAVAGALGDPNLEGTRPAASAYLDAPEAQATDILARAGHDAQAIADRQAQAVAQLDRLLADVAGTRRQLQAAQEAEDRLSAGVQAAADRVTAADQAIAERMRVLLDAYRSYLAGLAELRVAHPGELITALEDWRPRRPAGPAYTGRRRSRWQSRRTAAHLGRRGIVRQPAGARDRS